MTQKFHVLLFALCVLLLTCGINKARADVYEDYDIGTGFDNYHNNPDIDSRRTDHMLFRFGPTPKDGAISEQRAQSHMQMLESVYDTWRRLGLRDMGGTASGHKYRAIENPANTYLYDGPMGCVSFDVGPRVTGVHAPAGYFDSYNNNGATPHEMGHGWFNTAVGALPGTRDGDWSESFANWMMGLYMVDYPDNILSVGFTGAHALARYNSYAFLDYFIDAPGFGSNFINKWAGSSTANLSTDDFIGKALRVDTSGSPDHMGTIMDAFGIANAKTLDYDFWNRRVQRGDAYYLDSGHEYFFFNRIKMVRQPGVTDAWYRPEWTLIPQQFTNNYIPLTITATGSPRTVTCDFRPVSDAVARTSFRACFVAFNANKEARYSSVWSAGEKAFTLADDETSVYLAVFASPKVIDQPVNHNNYTLDNIAIMPYRIKLTGADPKDWTFPAPTGFRTHPNGLGKVASGAYVAPTAYVASTAMVLGTAKVYGNSRIEDYAVVDGNAVIGRSGQADDPVISGHAYVAGNAQVYGHAKVREHAWVYGNSKVYDNAVVLAHTMLNGSSIYGNAVMNQAPIRDLGMAFGTSDDISGYAVIGGDIGGASGVGTCTKGVYCHFDAWDTTDNQSIYAAYCFEKKSSIFAMDRWGMNHGYLMGEPLVKVDSINGITTNVLEINGTDQYVELKPDIVDFSDVTISAWVKWAGSTVNQRIFSTGDGNTKFMCLTPMDGTTNNLRFVISNGATTQYIDGVAPLASGTWTHVAVTLSGNTGTLYVNGAQVGQNTGLTIDPDQLHAPLMVDANYIGRGNSGNYFQGRIDEFRVYNKALSAAEVAAVKTDVIAGPAPAADTAAPTPSKATWVIPPTVVADTDISMSATEGTDAGGNGVLYYFRCVNDPTHDSGWISDNKFTDCKAAPGTTYTYTVKMKDKLGNTGSESGPQAATTPAMDTAAPTPNPPTFASAPKGSGTNAITMTATKGNDSDQIVMYKFSRVGGTATSGWTSSRTWTDTGLTSGLSYSYTLQMKDGHNNTTSTTTSASTVAADNTAPVLDTDYRLQWKRMPYTRLDKTVRMVARKLAETDVEYYYECVENPTINSGWFGRPSTITDETKWSPDWTTPAMADGIWNFRFRIRDKSTLKNVSAWSSTLTSKVTTTNSWHDYTINQLAGLPDDTLVRFTGRVSQVNPTNYIVSSTDGSISIKVRPRTFGNATHAELLNKTVSVQGHLWTYTGDAKMVTYAQVVRSPLTGRVEVEDGELGDGTTPRYDVAASGYECAGSGDSSKLVAFANVAATNTMYICHKDGSRVSLYINGTDAKDVVYANTSGNGYKTETLSSLSIPAGATVELRSDTGDSPGSIDYVIFGSAYTISGTVIDNVNGGAPAAGARVYFATTPNAVAHPSFVATTDSSGNYYASVPAGTWYASAGSEIQYVQVKSSTEQSTTVGPNKTGVNFQLNWSPGRTGKIEVETGVLGGYARPYYGDNTSAHGYVGEFFGNSSFELSNIKATSELTLAYRGGPCNIGLYVNDVLVQQIYLPTHSDWAESTAAVNIPDHAKIKLQFDPNDPANPRCDWDYIIVPGGPTASVSGYVRDSNGVGVPGATVTIREAPSMPARETVTSDATGHYVTSQNIPTGVVYLRATHVGYLSGSQSATVAGSNLDNVDILLKEPVSKVNFIKKDTTTKGTWKGVYGADGYNVVKNVTSYPSYATVTRVDSGGDYAWSTSTTDVRGLQKVNSTTDRIGAGWNTGQITFDVNFTDGNTHQIALYFVDWDNNNRRQTVEVMDADKISVVDSQNLSTSFNGGAWLVWEVKGSVRFRVTCTAGANAVLNGIFFAPAKVGVTRNITASAGLGGTINPSGTVQVTYGENKSFAITPNIGYVIDDVKVDNASVGAVPLYTFIGVTADYTISATFRSVPTFTLTASAGEGGNITPGGSMLVNGGTSKAFTITPWQGYAVADVKVDNVSIGKVGSHTFDNISADHTIAATFEALPVTFAGKVTDIKTGAAIAGASIYFCKTANQSTAPVYTATTDAQGNYSQEVIPGTWFVAAGKAGYDNTADQQITVDVASSPIADFQLSLTPFAVVYKLDETAGTTAADSSGSSKNGVLTNGPVWAAGRIGNCLDFDGVNDYVSVPDLGSSDAVTIAGWINLDTLGTDATGSAIMACDGTDAGDIQLLILKSGGKLRFTLNGNNLADSDSNYAFTSADFGKWRHVAVVYDRAAKTVKFYINGGLNATRTLTTTRVATLSNGVRVGGWSGGRYFDGKIDDLHIYGRALSANEIVALVNASPSIKIADAKKLANGEMVTLRDKVVTYAPRNASGTRNTLTFYIEESDRSAGLLVQDASGYQDDLSVDTPVTVSGIMKTITYTGQRYMELSALPGTGTATLVNPLGMSTKSVQTDISTLGLLVRVVGKVVEIDPDKVWFTMKDGYGVPTIVICETGIPLSGFAVGDTVVVTGAVGRDFIFGDAPEGIIFPRSIVKL